MLVYRRTTPPFERIYRTSTPAGVTASWIVGTRALDDVWSVPVRIQYVDDPTTDREPIEWPDVPILYPRRGHIAFVPYPTFDEARSRLPEHETLWAAIEIESIAASAGRVVIGGIPGAPTAPDSPPTADIAAATGPSRRDGQPNQPR